MTIHTIDNGATTAEGLMDRLRMVIEYSGESPVRVFSHPEGVIAHEEKSGYTVLIKLEKPAE